MIICFCSSTKFYDKVREYIKKLDKAGIKYYTPNITLGNAPITWEHKKQLTHEHNERIDKSDCIYVINEGGYIGESVSMEMAYAKGRGKKVYALEKALTPSKEAYIDEVISIEELIQKCIY